MLVGEGQIKVADVRFGLTPPLGSVYVCILVFVFADGVFMVWSLQH